MVNGLLTSLVLINLSPLLRHPYQFSSMKIHLVTALVIILSKVRAKIFLNYQLKKNWKKKNYLRAINTSIQRIIFQRRRSYDLTTARKCFDAR